MKSCFLFSIKEMVDDSSGKQKENQEPDTYEEKMVCIFHQWSVF